MKKILKINQKTITYIEKSITIKKYINLTERQIKKEFSTQDLIINKDILIRVIENEYNSYHIYLECKGFFVNFSKSYYERREIPQSFKDDTYNTIIKILEMETGNEYE